MASRSLTEARAYHPRSQQAFRSVKALIGCYLGISILTLVTVVLLRNNTAIVPVSVWVRGIIVVVHAGVTLLFAIRAARGSRVGYILLRLSSAIMVVAVAVILAIPGDFPLWFKIEQGICGLLLLGVAAVVNGKQLRSTFDSK
jgi:hypothetical protein